jgi:hypothetical protein
MILYGRALEEEFDGTNNLSGAKKYFQMASDFGNTA